jgi:hypothetical protein
MPRLPTKGDYPGDWSAIARRVKDEAGWKCVRCAHEHAPAVGRCLTVHHFDGDKANCARWNLMSLCQACHLSVQGRVDPAVPIMWDPSPWAMPYIAGFYEAGRGVIPASYNLTRWRAEYEAKVGAWPAWAPVPVEANPAP